MLRATPVKVAAVLVKDGHSAQPAGRVVVQAPGWVEADPFPVAVTALADGVVEEVLVLEGEPVNKGQVVARLIAEDAEIAFHQAQASCDEARAAAKVAEAVLEEARRNWEHPIELRRRVAAGDANVAEKRAEIDELLAEIESNEARARLAEYERVAPLLEAEHVSNIEWVNAKEDYESQAAVLKATKRRKPILEAQLTALRAEAEAAREDFRLRIADTRAVAEREASMQEARANVAMAEAKLAEAALRLDRMKVRSPVDGVAMVRLAEPGSKVMLNMDNPRSAQVLRVYDPHSLQVRVDIPLVDAAKVGVGQQAEIIVDVLPDRVSAGELTRVVHEADVQKNTLQVKVAIKVPTPELKPEMLARARFLGRGERDGSRADEHVAQETFVPEKAIIGGSTKLPDDGTAEVWLADQVEHVARRTSVVVSRASEHGWIEVIDGLQPGDRVIVDAPADLRDGARIKLIEE